LLFVHQLPSSPSNIRVRTWRRLQQIGAIVVKQAVYVLPDSPEAREDFEWLKTEIEGAGGQASVFSAGSVDAWSDDALVEEFRRARRTEYSQLADEITAAMRQLGARRRGRAADPDAHRLLERFRQRLNAIERLDFFGGAGRDQVASLIDRLERRVSPPESPHVKASSGEPKAGVYKRRLWVTRPRPGVDRMASAWLIRRFIDADARFGFVADRDSVPRQAVPFDMFGVEFSHRGGHCTFETLCETFGIRDSAVARVAAIVHDLDLKDGRFGASDAATVDSVIQGLQLAHSRDDVLLDHGMTFFDALYRSFTQAATRGRVRARAPRRGKRRR
jgi:hypothetical protein